MLKKTSKKKEMEREEKWKKRIKKSSLIQLPSQRSRPPQQFLQLVLLHLGLPSSSRANRVHRAVFAYTLDVGLSRVAGGLVAEGLVLRGAGGVHVLRADERGGVRLVCLATNRVRGFVDSQDSRVDGGFLGWRRGRRDLQLFRVAVLVVADDVLGLVERHRRRGRVEWTQVLGEFFDGVLDVGHVHGIVRLHVHRELLAILLGEVLSRVLHGLSRRRKRVHHILLFSLGRFLRGENGVKRLLARVRRNGVRNRNRSMDRKERRYMNIWYLVSNNPIFPFIPSTG